MSTNEAAERLRPEDCDHDDIEETFDPNEPPREREGWLYCRACNTHWQPRAGVLKALAAERRATVERIRAEVNRTTDPGTLTSEGYATRRMVLAILDEEAAR